MNLFQKKEVRLNSGKLTQFKIECDALTDEDMECIAYLIGNQVSFQKVFGVPTGGIRLQKALEKYCCQSPTLPILICDDVLTTGGSMKKFKEGIKKEFPDDDIVGVVIFARGHHEDWIDSLFIKNL